MRISANRKLMMFLVLSGMLLVLPLSLSGSFAHSAPATNAPTFYRDVLPILELHCQSCHRAGGIAPMPFETYEETRPFAGAIARATQDKSMPPWFADPKVGQFSNDPSLKPAEIRTLAAWADSKSPAGSAKDAPSSRLWVEGWSIPKPDLILKMPKAVPLPASGDIEYTFEIVPTNFKEDRWVQMAEVLPGLRSNVHHAVVYVRPPDSNWLRHAPVGVPFTASMLSDPEDRRGAHWTDSDVLLVYAPGSSPDAWPETMAKFIPAGSDLVFQMHYTTNGRAASEQSSIGLIFSKHAPKQQVLTLQLTNYHFHWQMSYRLAVRRYLKAGTELQAVAWYDNSKANLHNPDANAEVRWGEQTYDEMMVGFFDVAVAARVDKEHFFNRKKE